MSLPRIGGWLLVLCFCLAVWQPISVGLSSARALESLALRGPSLLVILITRLLVTAIGVGAVLALVNRRNGAVGLTRIALLAAGAVDLFIELTPYFPKNRAPGETLIYLGATLAYYLFWLLYLSRSRRVRETF